MLIALHPISLAHDHLTYPCLFCLIAHPQFSLFNPSLASCYIYIPQNLNLILQPDIIHYYSWSPCPLHTTP